MLLALPFPAIDPIIFELGPIAVRWYSLAYFLAACIWDAWPSACQTFYPQMML